MPGLYLYCIRKKTENTIDFCARGIDRKKGIFTIIHRELEAVVSRVESEEFASRETARNTIEDVNWIKEKAIIHEEVIEEAMKEGNRLTSVIPMRFGIIFKDKTHLIEALDKDYAGFKKILNKIRGKQEWSVKAYMFDRKKLEQAIKENSYQLKQKEEEMADMSEGMAYFMEEELKEAISGEINRTLDDLTGYVIEELKEVAEESVKTKILDSAITGKAEKMVINTAFLVQEDKIDKFKENLENIDDDLKKKGIYLEYSGPWPPFNFTSYRFTAGVSQ
jgi:hypothetical protein